jgi:hypothetical protein
VAFSVTDTEKRFQGVDEMTCACMKSPGERFATGSARTGEVTDAPNAPINKWPTLRQEIHRPAQGKPQTVDLKLPPERRLSRPTALAVGIMNSGEPEIANVLEVSTRYLPARSM